MSIPYHPRMTVEYHINLRDELITLTAAGEVCSSEACVCIDEMLNDPEFDSALPQLVDLREAELIGSEEDLQNFERFLLGDYGPRLSASVAIVVNTDWSEQICAKAFWFSCSLNQAELFDSWSQACKWLIQSEFRSAVPDLDALVEEPPATDSVPSDVKAQS